MHILWMLFVGFFVGLVARAVHPGDDKMGIIMTSLLGIAGAFVANYGGHALGLYQHNDRAGFFGATVGAFVLLVVVGVIRRMAR